MIPSTGTALPTRSGTASRFFLTTLAVITAKEYRIVLRVGCYAAEDQPLSENARNFDFHFLVQLDDGRWSQKYGWAADNDEISEWAREAAKKLMMQMIFRGTGDSLNFFIPKGEINRIEFAGMLRDYCQESAN